MFRRTLGGLIALVAALTLTGVAAQPAATLPAWKTCASSWQGEDARAPKIVDLRYATHPRYDRVVIEVRGRIPNGRAFYRRHFSYDGSGQPVPILGRSGLQVILFPAYAHNDAGHSVYDGPRIARPRFRTLKALALNGDFEGQVSFAFALTHRAPYRVFTLPNPQRIVIDFKHA
ncbi:AMIN-like domain-containing (lipo)protein [Nocardioides speluncae]|uniref:AMIN-like domain-containing (lipo)protein n=1 Tax=Nocardioides speluncae TaxID=2670337 RepID=UPI000D68FC79|nr:AMIN domain-containing protein [Nocardioides speluncae]